LHGFDAVSSVLAADPANKGTIAALTGFLFMEYH